MSPRPLSPHLQIYRLPFTAVLSILHRVTGVLLTFGMVVGVLGLLAFAEEAVRFQAMSTALNSVPGRIFLWAWLYSLFLHFSHGLRHLFWDSGLGFDQSTLNRNAGLVFAGSIALTGACYWLANYGS